MTTCQNATPPKRSLLYAESQDVLEECPFLGCDALLLVITDVSEERMASVIRLKRISELGTTFAVTSHGSIVRTDDSQEPMASIIRVKIISKLRTLAVTRD
jgi:hypothetical protein